MFVWSQAPTPFIRRTSIMTANPASPARARCPWLRRLLGVSEYVCGHLVMLGVNGILGFVLRGRFVHFVLVASWRPSWLRTWGPASSRASKRRIA